MSKKEVIKVPLTLYGVSLRPLNPKQRMFVVYYFTDSVGNGTDAAKRAGYKQPNISCNRLLNHEQIKRVMEKIQRKIGRDEELNIENVKRHLAQSLFRSKNDFVDKEGNPIVNLADLPDSVSSYLDGWEIENGVDEDEEGNPVVYPKKVKFKLSPTATNRDQAIKILGMNAPEKTEQTLTLDWGDMSKPPSDVDEVEQEIEGEYSIEGEDDE